MAASKESIPNCDVCGEPMQRAGTTVAGARRWRCAPGRVYCSGKTEQLGAKKFKRAPVAERPATGRFLITAAQNATPIHEGFFAALEQYSLINEAELLVQNIRYRNPNSRWSQLQESEEWWAQEVQPYLCNQRVRLHQHLILVGDVKIQPTAALPLSGFEGLTGEESCIIGHTKLQYRTVPVPAGRMPKILTTTGACTVANYTDSRAGKVGDFHHTLGACLVEIVGKKFHIRQIIADKDGSFIDLDKKYTAEGVEDAPPALAIILGDAHVKFMDPAVGAATFGSEGIIESLNPQTIVWHDVCDGYANNPHHQASPMVAIAKAKSGFGNVRAEVEETIQFVDRMTGDRQSVVVSSNHDNFLARWVQSTDWRTNPGNASFYLETAKAMVDSVEMTASGTSYADPFKYWFEKIGTNPNVRCLETDESFMVGGIELGMHGHVGPNGSRGSTKNLSKIGPKVVVGHSHSPSIIDGAVSVGTSTPLKLEYTHGPSSWMNTHCVIYANKKRSLINIIDGEWKK